MLQLVWSFFSWLGALYFSRLGNGIITLSRNSAIYTLISLAILVRDRFLGEMSDSPLMPAVR